MGELGSFLCYYVNCYYIHTYACNVNVLCEIYVNLLNYLLCIESFIEKRLRGCPEGLGNLGSQRAVGYSRWLLGVLSWKWEQS